MALIENNGDKLFSLFNELGVNLGKTDRTVVNGWFDSNCKETVDFLNWICNSINTNNVLTSQESDAYELLLDNDLLLSNEKYDAALEDLEINHTDIFNVENNLFNNECLMDEIAIADLDLDEADQSVANEQKLGYLLKNSMIKKRNEQTEAEAKKNVAKDKCMVLSNKLQDLNKQLEAQILKYGEHLINYDMESNPSFISSIPNEEYNFYCSDVTSVINRVIGKHKSAPSNDLIMSSTKNKLQQSLFNNTESSTILEEMQNRIANSIFKYVQAKSQEYTLESTLNYLNNLDLFEASTCILQGMDLYQMEGMIISKREQVKTITIDLEALAGQTSKKYINLPKLAKAEMDLKEMQTKNAYFTDLNAKISGILSFQFLTYLFYERENKNMEITDGFFKEVYQYITYDLKNYELRTEMMNKVIEDYNEYKSKPIVKQYKILQDVMELLQGNSKKEYDLQDVVNVVQQFRGECRNLEKRVYLNDVDTFKADCEPIVENIEVMKRFLMNGPTSEIISIPYNLYTTFKKVSNVLEQQLSIIKTTTILTNDTEKKISKDKWFNIRRQLWMYFLISPKKVLGFIEHIENELKMVTRSRLNV
ncbi:PREDICTED: uncharacterized protein LOC108562835 [Nicrophorus vespilloides]|uniref:Uncharacterized protein LOC108562835 n=1 Tax=Nicrophorus vespilloides TaxID=110193 RepID=A0ABM1MQE3_NICVS|nr:PREDICTED: uncharacterized protein LOC108562835 [Nicrophorus vespilloides]